MNMNLNNRLFYGFLVQKYLRGVEVFFKLVCWQVFILSILLQNTEFFSVFELFYDRIEQVFVIFIYVTKNCSSIEKVKFFV